MIVVVLLAWLAIVVAVGTLVGAVVGIRRDIARIAAVLERTSERDELA